MGLREAKEYIDALRKKQDNPFLWPDYLTGLPDRAAVLSKIEKVFPKIGRYGIAYLRIANIHPYLLKYGSERHTDAIQWAAGILKTVSKEVKGSFVGTVGTHDFLLIAPVGEIKGMIRKANRLFKSKIKTFYSRDDRERGYVISFRRDDGERVEIGFMCLVSVVLLTPPSIERINLIPALEGHCRLMEQTGETIKEVTV
jgi:GGDEF domain-containing protein